LGTTIHIELSQGSCTGNAGSLDDNRPVEVGIIPLRFHAGNFWNVVVILPCAGVIWHANCFLGRLEENEQLSALSSRLICFANSAFDLSGRYGLEVAMSTSDSA